MRLQTITTSPGIPDAPSVPTSDLPATPDLPVGAVEDVVAIIEDDPALVAIDRLTFGATPELVAEVRAKAVYGWIEEQLEPASIDDTDLELRLTGFTTLSVSPGVLRQTRHPAHEVRRELRVATLLRAVHSRRQLLESMVAFWNDHFSIDATNYWISLAAPERDRVVIRAHALGRFRDLLRADAMSPAMLAYLDNASSRAPQVNENYARELLELHTVGVNGGYAEADVRAAARVLSGWGFDPESVSFIFRDNRHDPAEAEVIGLRIPAGVGVERGLALLDHLAQHPATASHLARKLAARFIGPAASVGLVNRAAKAYLVDDTSIASLVRVLLTSDEFLASGGAVVRRPFDQLAMWLRATDATTDTTAGAASDGTRRIEWELAALGQVPFGWPTPDGYPTDEAHWSGSAMQLARWRFTSRLVAGRVKGVSVDLTPLWGDAGTIGDLVDRLAARLLVRPLTTRDRDALVAFGGGEDTWVGDVEPARLRELASLVLQSPATQRR